MTWPAVTFAPTWAVIVCTCPAIVKFTFSRLPGWSTPDAELEALGSATILQLSQEPAPSVAW